MVSKVNKILVVDDEIILCNALKYHLIQKGYEVEISTSDKDFQNKITTGKFDLMLLDLHLNGIDGLDLLRIARDINPDMKVIMVSSYLDQSNVSKARELGAYECVNKNSQMFQVLDQLIANIEAS